MTDLYAVLDVRDVRYAITAVEKEFPDVDASAVVACVLDSVRRSRKESEAFLRITEGPTMIDVYGNKKEERTCAFCGKTFETYVWADKQHCNVACQLHLDSPEEGNTMTDVEKARERLAYLTVPVDAEATEALIREVFAELRAAEVAERDAPHVHSFRYNCVRLVQTGTGANCEERYVSICETCGAAVGAPAIGAVGEPQPVAEPAKRMMQGNPRASRTHELRHEWRESCDSEPRCSAEPAKKRTVSAEARKKIVYALYRGYSSAEERADRIIAIIEADGAEAST